MDYQYPMDETWTKQEIIDVVNFFSVIEKAYESGAKRQDVLALYNRFKEIVPSKSEEKTLFAEFERASGYSSYKVVKTARKSEGSVVSM
ncbi:UPF0223 family protein [Virgibacillus xinjiangensis]|uniref:UPF0223 protein ACFOGI_08015 n=1 Tax=Virgibacillus xinjiangensis TaxID=393090 RepID=A0ABV7CV44_9BACI